MDRNLINISQIESFYKMLFYKKGITDNIFVGNLPITIATTMTNMMLIDCSVGINDLHSHGFGSVNVFLYAKPIGANMEKDIKTLNAMENALSAALDANTSLNYSVDINWHDCGYDTNRNLHYDVVNIKTTIK